MAIALWSESASSRRRSSGVSSGPGLSLSMPMIPTCAAAGPHRQEQALGARQRVGAAPGGAVVLPRPFGRRDVGIADGVLGRIAGLDGDGAVLRQQDDDPHLEHQGDLIGGRPQHVVERADAGELAAERVERLGGARARHRGDRLGADARRDVGDERRHDDEEHERRDIGRVGDGEGVDRRQEEEIVAQRGHRAGEQRRKQPVAHRDRDDRGQEHEIDVLDAEPRLDRPPAPSASRDRHQRDRVGARLERLRARFGGRRSSWRSARLESCSPAMTWTLILPARRTRSCTTEPLTISNQRERVDLPTMIWVMLLAWA